MSLRAPDELSDDMYLDRISKLKDIRSIISVMCASAQRLNKELRDGFENRGFMMPAGVKIELAGLEAAQEMVDNLLTKYRVDLCKQRFE